MYEICFICLKCLVYDVHYIPISKTDVYSKYFTYINYEKLKNLGWKVVALRIFIQH